MTAAGRWADDAATADVVVVGCGPVGKLLAVLLGRRGHRVVVLDRQVAGYPLPRAVTHDAEFARILQTVGLAPPTIPDVTEPYDDMYVWRNHDGDVLEEVDWSGLGESGWFNTYFFHQPALEERLEGLMAQLPVTVVRGWEAVEQREDVASVTVTISRDGDRREIRGRYLIGADGAGSGVRARMGSGWHDLGYFFDWLVVDVVPDPSIAFPHVAIQTCDTARPCTMVPGGPGRRRWEFMRLPTETRDELNRTDRAWELLVPYGISRANSLLERHSVYTFQAGWATTWRRGRVMIAGDAAHLMPPFAGQGLGAGFRDAVNLGWKLDLVLRGLADDALLDTYGAERTPHVAAFIDFSMQLGQVICITDPELAAARDARMIAARAARESAPAPPRPRLGPGIHTGDAGGTLSRQGRVVRHGAPAGTPPVLLDDAVGGAGLLLLRRGEPLASLTGATRKTLQDSGIAVAALTPEGAGAPSADGSGGNLLVDVDGTVGQWLDSLGADAVLVRPDFAVFAAASGPGATQQLADSFVEHLARHRADHLAGHPDVEPAHA